MTDPSTHIANAETQASPENLTPNNFDGARIFADPVAYLERFGLRSELIETRNRELPAAA